jgi:hypothetical protein
MKHFMSLFFIGLVLLSSTVQAQEAQAKLRCEVLLSHFPKFQGESVAYFTNRLRSTTIADIQNKGLQLKVGDNYFYDNSDFYYLITADFEKKLDRDQKFKSCKVKNLLFSGERFKGNLGFKVLAYLSLPFGVTADITLSALTLGIYPLLNLISHMAFKTTSFVTNKQFVNLKYHNDTDHLTNFLDEGECNNEGLRALLNYQPKITCY